MTHDVHEPAITWHRPDWATRPPTDLIGHTEIARAAGVTRAAVSNWSRRRPDWPKPVATIAGGPAPRPLYDRTEIAAWLDAHPPRSPRPDRAGADRLALRRYQLARVEARAAQLRDEIAELDAAGPGQRRPRTGLRAVIHMALSRTAAAHDIPIRDDYLRLLAGAAADAARIVRGATTAPTTRRPDQGTPAAPRLR